MPWGVALTARLAAIAALLVVSACASVPQSSPTPIRVEQARRGPVRVGAILSLTGLGADRGRQQYNGLMLAVEQLNRDRAAPAPLLQLTALDDNSSRDRLRTQLDTLINQQRVVAVLGPSLPGLARTLAPACQEASVPLLALVGDVRGLPETGDYVFSDSLVDSVVVPQVVHAARRTLHVKTAGLLYESEDAFTRMEGGVFRQALQQSGIQVSIEQTFTRNERDLSIQLTAIKDAAPDAVFVSALAGEAPGIVAQARRLGLQQPIVGGSGFNSPALIQNAGTAAEGVVVGSAWSAQNSNPVSQAFVRDYRARYGSDPDQYAAEAFAGVHIVSEGLKLARTTNDRKALRDGLAQVNGLETVLGSFSFTPAGEASYPASILQVSGGQFRLGL